MTIDNREYVELPPGYGPSGSQGEYFELKKRDGKLWIPKSRLKDWDEQITNDLALENLHPRRLQRLIYMQGVVETALNPRRMSDEELRRIQRRSMALNIYQPGVEREIARRRQLKTAYAGASADRGAGEQLPGELPGCKLP